VKVRSQRQVWTTLSVGVGDTSQRLVAYTCQVSTAYLWHVRHIGKLHLQVSEDELSHAAHFTWSATARHILVLICSASGRPTFRDHSPSTILFTSGICISSNNYYHSKEFACCKCRLNFLPSFRPPVIIRHCDTNTLRMRKENAAMS
jgi:hypothetical protein